MPGLPVLHHLPDFAQTHVHWVSDAIQPSHPLLSPSPPDFKISQHQGLFQSQLFASGGQRIEHQLQHQFFQWRFRVDLLPLRFYSRKYFQDFPGGLVLKNPPANAGKFQSLLWEDSTCHGATKLVGHNCWARTLELVLHNKRSHHNEKSAHCNKE